MKTALAIIGGVIALIAVCFGLNIVDLGMFGFFAPKYEAIRTKTFQQSQSYNEGMRRDLENLRNDYLSAKDPGAKAALRATFIHRAEGYLNQLPPDIESFYNQLQNVQ